LRKQKIVLGLKAGSIIPNFLKFSARLHFMTDRPEPVSDERVVFQGNILEIVRQDMDIEGEEVPFEWARRAPGTRLIIDDGDQILLTEEYRHEIEGLDYRLPGGKVFDSLNRYNDLLNNDEEIMPYAREAASAEAKEEAGVRPESIEFYKQNHSGATVEWDLYYFVVEDFEEVEQNLEKGEQIDFEWYSHDRVKEMCLEGEMREDRSVAVLLQYLNENNFEE
jgi:8-oxo-dGTP pyrophosphatase MutT (NUDIX family)